MRERKIKSALLLGLLLICGCNNQQTSNIEKEKQRWSQEGWKYFETVGSAANDAAYVSHMNSITARSVTAFASSGGISTNHIYEQTNALYLVDTMQRPNGDTFALVFEKPKP